MNYHRIEMVRGPCGRDTAPAIKTAVRFGRRLRQRNIHNVNFDLLYCDTGGIKVEVGRRVVRIDEEGRIRQEMLPQPTSHGWRADPQGARAHRNRAHVLFLEMAASGRRFHTFSSARIMIDAARMDRLYRSIV